MRYRMFVFGACAALAPLWACAHGPQIQITDTGDKIVTRQLLLDEPYSSAVGLTAPAEVYVMPVLSVSYLGQPVMRVKPSDTQTFGPGFTYGYDQTVGTDHLFTANLNLHVAGLEIWDGTNFVPTGAGKEQLGLLQSTSNVNTDSVKTTAAGGDIAVPVTPGYTADVHSSMRYTLLGDGLDPYAPSGDGVYLVSLQLSSTQAVPALSPSDAFYFVLNKNGTAPQLAAAVNSLLSSTGISRSLVQYAANVPEPSCALLAAVGLAVSTVGRLGLRRGKRGNA